MSQEFTVQRFVCTGFVTLTSKKPGVTLQPINADGELGGVQHYERKKLSGVYVGGVYEIEASETSIKLGTKRWIETYQSRDKVLEWQSIARAEETRQKAARREKKAREEDNMIAEALIPLRKVYAKLLPSDREAFELVVLGQLRRRVQRDE